MPVMWAYIDGFNLYHGAICRCPGTHWLDLRRFCSRYVPNGFELGKIKYFTALVDDLPSRTRQLTYIDAHTVADIEIVYGQFRTHPRWSRLVDPQPLQQGGDYDPELEHRTLNELGHPKRAWVYKTEEKGSDVNLATHLMADAHYGHFQGALVVSEDSDLKLPLDLVRKMSKPIWVANPRARWQRELAPDPRFNRKVQCGHLVGAQFPDVVTTPAGRDIMRPRRWAPKTSKAAP
jgi:hypothetical protein